MDDVDKRTNQAPSLIDVEVNEVSDFFALRKAWTQGAPIPKLLASSETAPKITITGQDTRVLVNGEESAGTMAVFEAVVHPGFGAPAHHQANEEEWWYILEGRLEVTIGERTETVGPGASAFAPRGATHAFFNHGPDNVRMIVINAPAGHERFFKAVQDASPTESEEARASRVRAHDVHFRNKGTFKLSQEPDSH